MLPAKGAFDGRQREMSRGLFCQDCRQPIPDTIHFHLIAGADLLEICCLYQGLPRQQRAPGILIPLLGVALSLSKGGARGGCPVRPLSVWEVNSL
jgi:hypothetical protein